MRASRLVEVLQQLASDGGFFDAFVFGDDPGTFAIQLDEADGTAVLGCLLLPDRRIATTGTPSLSFELFWVRRRGEDLSAEEWGEARDELSEQIDCFCRQLRPFVWSLPNSFERFDDMALVGFWAEFTAVSDLVCCGDVPTPPVPEGEFYDYLQAANGSGGRNVFLYMGLGGYIDGQLDRLEIGGVINSNGLFVVRLGAGSYGATSTSAGVITSTFGTTSINLGRTDVEVFYDFTDRTYGGVNADGETVSGECRLGYGTRDFFGFLQFFSNRAQNNTYTQRLRYFRHFRGGVLMRDWRPYLTGGGVAGLKDTITGEFLAPQYNDTITVGNENTQGRSLLVGDMKALADLSVEGLDLDDFKPDEQQEGEGENIDK